MKFLALACALLLEQAWPLRRGNPLYAAFERYADYLERQFNGLQANHGVIAWLVAVLPLALLTVAVHALLREANVLLAMVWSVAVLYVAMGFRRFSHCFTEIAQALRAAKQVPLGGEQNINTARDVLGRWRGVPADELQAAEISRVAIELGLLQAHRYVLGPIFWFVILGPVGPVVYRAADLLAARWGKLIEPERRAFALFAERAFFWIDWFPARVTAASFAIAGNFEDAAYCWRTQAAAWGRGPPGGLASQRAEGVVLASGAGALGVKLGGVLREEGMLNQRPELGIGDEVDVEDLRGAVGLIWRALVLWLFLLLIVAVAGALG